MIFLRKRKNSGFKTAAVGLYCNLVFSVIASEETAYNVKMYFIIFAVCKLIFCKKGRKT